VREYWIVNPYIPTVHLFRLDEKRRYARVEEADGKLVSEVIPGFYLRPEWLFQDPASRVMDCLREMGINP
jgi:Uma2 family endonuclease